MDNSLQLHLNKKKIKITVGKQTIEAPINYIPPKLLKGWWSSDKEGNQHIKESNLGETVYFSVAVQGVPIGTDLSLKLFDKDSYILDWVDDDKFPDKEYKVTTQVIEETLTTKIRRAVVELYLDESWAPVIEDDAPEDAILLYWEVKIKGYQSGSYNINNLTRYLPENPSQVGLYVDHAKQDL